MKWQEAKALLLQDEEARREYEKIDLAFEIGKMITDARIATKMSQQTLAKKIGTKQPSIARIESGNHLPSLTFLQKIAAAFGTELLPPKFALLEKSHTIAVIMNFEFNHDHSPLHNIDYSKDSSWNNTHEPRYGAAQAVRINREDYIYAQQTG